MNGTHTLARCTAIAIGADRAAPPFGCCELVAAPVRLVDALADRARLRLVLQRHAVREAHDLRRLVERQVAAVREPHLDHERVAAVHASAAASSTRRTPPSEAALQALDEQRLADRHDAVAGGAITFTSPSALCSRSSVVAVDRARPASSGSPSPSCRSASATGGRDAREVVHRAPPSRSCPASRSACVWSIPSSTPCGCGLISCASRGSSFVTRGNSDPLALRRHVRERQVRVRDDGLLEVLLHAGAPAAVRRDQLDLDARPVLARAVPLRVPVHRSTRSRRRAGCASCRCGARSGTRAAPCPSCSMIDDRACPVVSCP